MKNIFRASFFFLLNLILKIMNDFIPGSIISEPLIKGRTGGNRYWTCMALGLKHQTKAVLCLEKKVCYIDGPQNKMLYKPVISALLYQFEHRPLKTPICQTPEHPLQKAAFKSNSEQNRAKGFSSGKIIQNKTFWLKFDLNRKSWIQRVSLFSWGGWQ